MAVRRGSCGEEVPDEHANQRYLLVEAIHLSKLLVFLRRLAGRKRL